MFFLPLGGPDFHILVHCVCTGQCRILGVSRHSAARIGVNHLGFFGVSETSPFIRQGHMHRLSPWPLAPGSWLVCFHLANYRPDSFLGWPGRGYGEN